ncbi:MAG: hypothetical protein P8Q14_09330, partial [Vicingaceae bacterium]|nr:hypothetical protein [Vicingaceae bacterium]
ENEDNPPLENLTVEAYQLNRYLIAHLETGKNYKLIFKNKELKTLPNYDINHFKSNIIKDVPILKTKELSVIKYKKRKKVTTSTLWIWGAIGGVALLLAYISYKMITEMDKN